MRFIEICTLFDSLFLLSRTLTRKMISDIIDKLEIINEKSNVVLEKLKIININAKNTWYRRSFIGSKKKI